jgi:hypothetical protein
MYIIQISRAFVNLLKLVLSLIGSWRQMATGLKLSPALFRKYDQISKGSEGLQMFLQTTF